MAATLQVQLQLTSTGVTELPPKLREAKGASDELSGSFERMKAILGQLGISFGVFETFKALAEMSVGDLSKIEDATVQLDSALRATGEGAGWNKDQLEAMAVSLEKTTKLTEAQILSAEQLQLRYQNIKGEQFPQALGLAADIAAAKGRDFSEVLNILDRALQQPAQGVGRLSMLVGKFTLDEQESIKTMAAHGDVAGAQAKIFELLGSFMGSAAAAAGTLSGQWTILKRDTEEALGSILKASGGFDDLKGGLSSVVTVWKAGLLELGADLEDFNQRLNEWMVALLEFFAKGVDALVGVEKAGASTLQTFNTKILEFLAWGTGNKKYLQYIDGMAAGVKAGASDMAGSLGKLSADAKKDADDFAAAALKSERAALSLHAQAQIAAGNIKPPGPGAPGATSPYDTGGPDKLLAAETKLIAKFQEAEDAARKKAAAELLGAGAEKIAAEAADAQRIATDAVLKLDKLTADQKDVLVKKITAIILATKGYDDARKAEAAFQAEQIKNAAAVATEQAKITDALTGSTVASEANKAAVSALGTFWKMAGEQGMESVDGLTFSASNYNDILALVIKAETDDSVALTKRQRDILSTTVATQQSIQVANQRVRQITEDRTATDAMRVAEASLLDAQQQTKTNSEAMTIQIATETQARADGIPVTSKMYDLLLLDNAIRGKATQSIKDQAAAQLQLNQLNREVQQAGAVAAINRDDFANQVAYDQAVKVTVEHLKEEWVYLDAIAAGKGPAYAEALRNATAELFKFNEQLERSKTSSADEIGKAISTLATSFHGVNDSAEKWLQTMVKVKDAYQAVLDSANKGLAAQVAAAAQLGSTIGALLQKTGQGGFGGAGESNFAGVGGTAGGIIGGIIGSIFFGQTAAGAAIGGVVGSAIGSIIHKGGDYAEGVISLVGDQLSLAITGERGKVSTDLSLFASDIQKGFHDMLAAIGGTVASIPEVGIKIRDGLVEVMVGAVGGTFSQMADAVTFAVKQLLSQSDISGITDNMRRVLQNTTATTMQDLASDLNFGKLFDQMGMNKAAIDAQNLGDQLRAMAQRMAELGLATQQNEAKLAAWYNQQQQALKDSILGIQQDPAERIKEQAAAFNQQQDLMHAQALLDKADLLEKKAVLQGKIELDKAALQADQADLKGRGAVVKAGIELDSASLQADAAMLSADQAALDAINAALVAVGIIIDSTIKITDAEIAAAIARAGKGAGGSDIHQQQQDMIDQLTMSGLKGLDQQIAQIVKNFDSVVDSIKKLHFSAAETAKLIAEAAKQEADQLAQLKKTTLDSVQDFIDAGLHPAAASINSAIRQMEDNAQTMLDNLLALREAGLITAQQFHELSREVRQSLAAQEAALAQQTIDAANAFIQKGQDQGGFGLQAQLDAIDQSSKKLGDDLDALHAKGLISDQLWKQLTASIAASADAQKKYLAGQDASNFMIELYGYLGNSAAAEKIKWALTVATLEAKREELRIAEAQGLISHELFDQISKLVDQVVAAGDPTANANANAIPPGYIWTGAGFVPGPTSGAVTPQTTAQQLLDQYTSASQGNAAADRLDLQLEKIETDFAKIRAALGNTADVQVAYAAAVHDAITKFLQPIQQLAQGLYLGADSPLTAFQRYQLAMANLMKEEVAFRSGDLSGVSQIPTEVNAVLTELKNVFPVGSQAYKTIFGDISGFLNEVLSLEGPSGPVPAPLTASDISTPVVSAVKSQTDQLQSNSDQQVAVLQAIAANTASTASDVSLIRRSSQQGGLLTRVS